jgi:hypothetical protein
MTLFRAWSIASGVVFGAGLIWAYVPILVPLMAVAAILAAMTWGIVSLARWFEGRRHRD